MSSGEEGSVLFGSVVRVCDVEVEVFKLVLDSLPVTPFLILSGPSASIVVVPNASACVSVRNS